MLRRNGQDIAMLSPLPPPRKRRRREPTQEDYEAFLSAAGGWKDVDTDTLIEDIYAARRID